MYRAFHVTGETATTFQRALGQLVEKINREADWFLSSVSHAANDTGTHNARGEPRTLFSAVLIVQKLGER